MPVIFLWKCSYPISKRLRVSTSSQFLPVQSLQTKTRPAAFPVFSLPGVVWEARPIRSIADVFRITTWQYSVTLLSFCMCVYRPFSIHSIILKAWKGTLLWLHKRREMVISSPNIHLQEEIRYFPTESPKGGNTRKLFAERVCSYIVTFSMETVKREWRKQSWYSPSYWCYFQGEVPITLSVTRYSERVHAETVSQWKNIDKEEEGTQLNPFSWFAFIEILMSTWIRQRYRPAG